MSDTDNTLLALARLEASLARLETELFGAMEAFARLRRIERLIEQIALSLGISSYG